MEPYLRRSEVCVRHHRIDVDGVDAFYREAGPAEEPVMPRLADRYRCIAPDFSGSGFTQSGPTQQCDFDGQADFLRRFADRVGASRFVLSLHDFGGSIGLRLATRAPERVMGLIV